MSRLDPEHAGNVLEAVPYCWIMLHEADRLCRELVPGGHAVC